MKEQNEMDRNRPSDKGSRKDPNIRDESAIQPGVSTISKSTSDDTNEDVTHSGMDNLGANVPDDHADPAFDEIDKR